jgi:hypothetical protein
MSFKDYICKISITQKQTNPNKKAIIYVENQQIHPSKPNAHQATLRQQPFSTRAASHLPQNAAKARDVSHADDCSGHRC